MPSEHKVTIERITKIYPHPNADRLDIATVLGWQVVVQRGQYKVGDLVIYFPIDSVLPYDVESKIFGAESKVKLSKSRVKTIKLRGAVSQGLVVPVQLFWDKLPLSPDIGEDVMKNLGVTKYQQPEQFNPNSLGLLNQTSKRNGNPLFQKYTHINRMENYPDALQDGKGLVVVTEKIHGTNFRCGWVNRTPKSLWDKVKLFISEHTSFKDLYDPLEFVYGSHNVQLQDQKVYNGYHVEGKSNVYLDAVNKYGLKTALRERAESYGQSVVVYGEIYGPGIQKNYDYGSKDKKLILFDVMLDGEYIDWNGVREVSQWIGVDHVPVLAMQTTFTQKELEALRDGPSNLCPTQKIKEGIVVRSYAEQKTHYGRAILKMISPNYLLKEDNTEWS